jgi:hypothetical protein
VVVTGPERVRVIDEVAEFLVDFLGDGVVASGEVMAAVFSVGSLKRAKLE